MISCTSCMKKSILFQINSLVNIYGEKNVKVAFHLNQVYKGAVEYIREKKFQYVDYMRNTVC